MNKKLIGYAIVLLCVGLLLTPAWASWPEIPADNLAVADRTGDQTVPKIAADSEGGCYVAWYDHASGNYDVYLQHLSTNGEELWPHNGILVSGHPQDTWLCDWDLTVDGDDNAIVVFPDIRTGGDWDIYAYKISPTGLQLWGEDGIALTDNTGSEYSPMVAVATDGDAVVVWSDMPQSGDGKIVMQRISPAGALRLPANGLIVGGEVNESPGFCDLVASEDGDVIVTWERDLSYYMSPSHIWADRFDENGLSVWGTPQIIYDLNPLPMGYAHEIQSDGGGGAVILWHVYQGGYYQSRVQHLDADGNQLLTASGLQVTTAPGMHHISPTMAVGPAGDIFVFWDERNGGQSQWGLYGQRITTDGLLDWGSRGQMFLPTDTLYKSHYRALPTTDGAMVFWIDDPGSDRIRAFRVDGDGIFVWAPTPIAVSTAPGDKWRLPVAQAPNGQALLVWEDDRSGSSDIFGMRVNLDGSLGGDGTPVDDRPVDVKRLELSSCFPNPFNPTTTIRFSLPHDSFADLAVYDMTGRRVKTLVNRELAAGHHELIWDGTDARGQCVASGVYFSRIEADGQIMSRRMVLLK
ncbi:MAG: T9SS type A sorting domain-containing protein [bacterium]|nr:T9SS type A sorting domain-containing protein [bacterium]